MRVMMVSTSYPRDASDWRGVFIRHLVNAMARDPAIDLSLWAPPGELPANVEPLASPPDSLWLGDLMEAGGIAHLMRSGGIRGLLSPLKLLNLLRNAYRRSAVPDVYHVNWLQNAVVIPGNGKPLLATVLGTDMQLLKLPGMTHALRRVFRSRRSVICPNARWMVPELETRFGDVARVQFVPFGIEPRWFDIQRQPSAITGKAWACVSRVTHGKIGTLFDWGEPYFSGGQRELHLFGPMQESMQIPDWVHYHGAATADTLCNDWFPKIQGLITLSQHAEGRPQVMLEAMAAGVPIIASRISAHQDMLEHQVTGWLCPDKTTVGSALAALETESNNREMGQRARTVVRAEVGTWEDCVARYSDLYDALSS